MDCKLLATRISFRIASKRKVSGLTLAALASHKDCQFLFRKCEQAIRLIQDHDRRTYAYVVSNARSVLVMGDPTAKGYWIEALKMIELQEEWLKDAKTTVEEVACVMVHETTHARLRKLGFGYEEKDRLRIERICYRAQRNFARKLPDAHYLAEHYDKRMKSICERDFSNVGRAKAKLRALRYLGCPEIAVRWLERRWMATLARSAAEEQSSYLN